LYDGVDAVVYVRFKSNMKKNTHPVLLTGKGIGCIILITIMIIIIR